MEKEGLVVVSIFDGSSCAQIALERFKIKVKEYFASEINKFCINLTQKRYPKTVQLGNVEFLTKQNQLKNKKVDLLIGGSPCQGFSNIGSGLNFKDPRSILFFEFVRLKNELKPKFFLLENVSMKKEWQDVISKYLGVEPIFINSNLVSAQNRKRLYWTNIPNVSIPEDKKINLSDILETDYKFNIYNKKGTLKKNTKAGCLTGTAHAAGNHSEMDVVVKEGEKLIWTESGKRLDIHSNEFIRRYTVKECERLQTMPEGYFEGVSNTQAYTMLINGWTIDVIAHILKNIK